MSINHSILDYSSAKHIPKKVYSFKSRHLCQWPQGSRRSQVEYGSLVQFSLSASQAIPVTSSALLSYCFAYKMQICLDDRQGSLLPSRKACLSFLKLLTAYLGADTRSPPPAAWSKYSNKNIHPTWGPAGTPLSSAELLQTAQNCVQLQHPPKGCFSSWGLPEFTNGLSIPPASPQLRPRRAPPVEGRARGCCGGQAPAARWYRGIPLCTSGAEAMDASQGSGSQTAYFR